MKGVAVADGAVEPAVALAVAEVFTPTEGTAGDASRSAGSTSLHCRAAITSLEQSPKANATLRMVERGEG